MLDKLDFPKRERNAQKDMLDKTSHHTEDETLSTTDKAGTDRGQHE